VPLWPTQEQIGTGAFQGWNKFELYLNIQLVPYSKHTTVYVIKARQLMLYREIITVCSPIHTENINTLFGQNVELLCVKLFVTELHINIQSVPRSKHPPSLF
jgi:hypothetical protein